MSNSALAVLVASVSLAGLLFGMGGQAILLGMSTVVLIVLLSAIGLRAPDRPVRRALAVLIAWGAVFCLLLALGQYLHVPEGPLVLIGGFPAGTAMLVYGITPLGITLGLLYGFFFDGLVLPADRQRAFLDRFTGK